jgi:amidohydrolase family protein
MIIDVHAHAASEDFIRATASKPSYGMPYEVRPDGSYATRGYGEMDRLMWDLDGRLERLERRGIDLHATTAITRETLGEYTLNTVIAWPTEVTIAATRLIFSGVIERHPGLRLVLSHAGGTLPYLAGRLDLAYHAPKHEANPACRANITKPPSHYLSQIYYDTVVASPASLRF